LDEKTSIQARQPIRTELPMRLGKPARREFEYKCHGVQALLAALRIHSGEVIGNVYDRNTRVEFLDFLGLLEAQIPAGKEVHAILDNLQVHKTPDVKQWLDDHPGWTFHFTPARASWLNQIELFFSILTRRLIRRACSPANPTSDPTPPVHRSLQPDSETIRLDLRGKASPRINPNNRY
jgi:transposase